MSMERRKKTHRNEEERKKNTAYTLYEKREMWGLNVAGKEKKTSIKLVDHAGTWNREWCISYSQTWYETYRQRLAKGWRYLLFWDSFPPYFLYVNDTARSSNSTIRTILHTISIEVCAFRSIHQKQYILVLFSIWCDAGSIQPLVVSNSFKIINWTLTMPHSFVRRDNFFFVLRVDSYQCWKMIFSIYICFSSFLGWHFFRVHFWNRIWWFELRLGHFYFWWCDSLDLQYQILLQPNIHRVPW